MRVLVVADEYPWPARSGYRLRLAEVVRTLSAGAQVDLLVAVLPSAPAREPAPACVRSCTVVAAGVLPGGRVRRAGRWLLGGRPRALSWRDWGAVRTAAAGLLAEPYDLVWFSHAAAHVALGDLVTGPRVVDLDNLEGFLLRHRRGAREQAGPAARALDLADALDERRWHRLERGVADGTRTVAVCSELDRGRLGAGPGVVVVPNGYSPAEPPAPRTPAPDPVLLLVGLLTYAPNLDAARYAGAEVLPRLRRSVPGARLRVVGRYDDPRQVAPLTALEAVTVVGEVPAVGPELAAAAVAVVPVRFGGGTRIKVLEAFAHGVPVVSTTVGCEGLDVVAGVHLLVADDADAFAAACAQLLVDPALRDRLVEQARALWHERYRWEVVRPAITAAARHATG